MANSNLKPVSPDPKSPKQHASEALYYVHEAKNLLALLLSDNRGNATTWTVLKHTIENLDNAVDHLDPPGGAS